MMEVMVVMERDGDGGAGTSRWWGGVVGALWDKETNNPIEPQRLQIEKGV